MLHHRAKMLRRDNGKNDVALLCQKLHVAGGGDTRLHHVATVFVTLIDVFNCSGIARKEYHLFVACNDIGDVRSEVARPNDPDGLVR